jgi:hypothetical protein
MEAVEVSSDVARRRVIVVQRSYRPDRDAEERALRLLWKHKKAAGTSGGADAGKEMNDSGAGSIQHHK